MNDPQVTTPPADPPAAPPATAPAAAAPTNGATAPANGTANTAESWARPDWREAFAKNRGGDEKLVNRLSRYASPDAALDALVSVQNKISANELRLNTPFPANGTDEQKAEWRRGAGVPESPDKYAIELGNGLVIGEEDKPFVESFLKAAHNVNLPNDKVNGLLSWYFKDLVEGETQKRQELDEQVREKADDQLHVEWGADYRKNKALIEAYLDSGPSGLKERLFSARLGDGTPLASDVEILRWLADRAREFNPTISLVPGDPSAAAKTIADELATIKAMMPNRSSEYWKGPKAPQLQARYRELVAASQKVAQRAA